MLDYDLNNLTVSRNTRIYRELGFGNFCFCLGQQNEIGHSSPKQVQIWKCNKFMVIIAPRFRMGLEDLGSYPLFLKSKVSTGFSWKTLSSQDVKRIPRLFQQS